MEDRQKCQVREGRFVDPCESLTELIDVQQPAFSSAKGIFISRRTNIETGKPSRSMIGIRTKAHPKGGFLFNFCPICGENISAPFMQEDEQLAALKSGSAL